MYINYGKFEKRKHEAVMTSTAHVVLKEDSKDFNTLLPSDLKPNTKMMSENCVKSITYFIQRKSNEYLMSNYLMLLNFRLHFRMDWLF